MLGQSVAATVSADVHRAELVDREGSATAPDALLPKQYGAGRATLNADSQVGVDRREQQEGDGRNDLIGQPFEVLPRLGEVVVRGVDQGDAVNGAYADAPQRTVLRRPNLHGAFVTIERVEQVYRLGVSPRLDDKRQLMRGTSGHQRGQVGGTADDCLRVVDSLRRRFADEPFHPIA